jgi:hypothetical protein
MNTREIVENWDVELPRGPRIPNLPNIEFFFGNLCIKIRFEVCDYDIKSVTNKQEDNVMLYKSCWWNNNKTEQVY